MRIINRNSRNNYYEDIHRIHDGDGDGDGDIIWLIKKTSC